MPKRKQPPPAAPAPPTCPQCTTPHLCRAHAWHEQGTNCQQRQRGADDCDCINYCGDDPWLMNGRARGCSKFYKQSDNRPVAIWPRVIVATDMVAGPFSPLPYELLP